MKGAVKFKGRGVLIALKKWIISSKFEVTNANANGNEIAQKLILKIVKTHEVAGQKMTSNRYNLLKRIDSLVF